MEQWKIIPYSKNYSVSSEGRVRRETPGRRTRKGYVLSPGTDRYGYHIFVLHESGVKKTHKAHRLVMDVFGDDRPSEDHTIDHIDRNRKNNKIGNLRWASAKEQQSNSVKNPCKGSRVANSRLDDEKVREIREWYAKRNDSYHDTENSLPAIARHYGVGMQTVHAVVTGRTWKHVI